jgi:L-ascorbate metabolism protein UlaG (beta-lactamase superfamily)
MIGARSLAFGWWWGRTDVVADPQRSQLRFIDASRQGGAVGDRECRAVSLVRVLYVGGPTAVIEIGPWRLITDPTFDPPGGRYFFGWGTASRKLHGPAIEFSELGRIDAVLLSHDHHQDNLDRAGRQLLSQMGAVITTKAGARRLGVDARGLGPWGTTALQANGRPPIEITATPCRHGPPGSAPIVGQVIGFSLTWEGQSHGSLWLSGDTVRFAGLRDVARRTRVSAAVLNLGGVTFPWLSGPLRYTLNADEAIELCRELNPRSIVPLHFEGWKHFREPRDTAIAKFDASPFRDRIHWLARGATIEIDV